MTSLPYHYFIVPLIGNPTKNNHINNINKNINNISNNLNNNINNDINNNVSYCWKWSQAMKNH